MIRVRGWEASVFCDSISADGYLGRRLSDCVMACMAVFLTVLREA